jgi:hypothetical protein
MFNKNKNKDSWYSNCLIEAVKAKIKWGNKIKVVFIPAKRNENYCPHFMWIDLMNGTIKDFHAEVGFQEKWWNFFVFKGHIRCRSYSVYERWLNTNIWS